MDCIYELLSDEPNMDTSKRLNVIITPKSREVFNLWKYSGCRTYENFKFMVVNETDDEYLVVWYAFDASYIPQTAPSLTAMFALCSHFYRVRIVFYVPQVAYEHNTYDIYNILVKRVENFERRSLTFRHPNRGDFAGAKQVRLKDLCDNFKKHFTPVPRFITKSQNSIIAMIASFFP